MSATPRRWPARSTAPRRWSTWSAILWETGRQKFQTLHVMGARTVAEQAKAAGVKRLVQISAIGADVNSVVQVRSAPRPRAKRPSAPPSGAVVVRPSIVFGAERQVLQQVRPDGRPAAGPAADRRRRTKFQPVYVGDVAAVIAKAVASPAAEGLTYELGGPAVYSFKELMELILVETGRNRVPGPDPVLRRRLDRQGRRPVADRSRR